MANNNDITLRGSSGIIYSPDYSTAGNYQSRMQCTWRIEVSSGHHIQLTFTQFELESKPLPCSETDHVDIRDGSSSSDRLIGQYCSKNKPSTIISKGKHLWVRFKSFASSQGGKGFVAKYKEFKDVSGMVSTLCLK